MGNLEAARRVVAKLSDEQQAEPLPVALLTAAASLDEVPQASMLAQYRQLLAEVGEMVPSAEESPLDRIRRRHLSVAKDQASPA